MKINDLRINHIANPIGYSFSYLYFTWNVSEVHGKQTSRVRIRIWNQSVLRDDNTFYDSGENSAEHKYNMKLSLPLKPCTRYYWKVQVTTDSGETAESEAAFFETGKVGQEWKAEWISAEELESMPFVYRDFEIKKKVETARIYCLGYGLYELYADDKKVSEEYLMPGYHSYDLLQEYQTYELPSEMCKKGVHRVGFLLGDGWYKGRFVFEGGFTDLYGNQKRVIAEIHLKYEDGTTEIIGTDNMWKACTSQVLQNGIYDGEIQDLTKVQQELKVFELSESKELLRERSSIPLVITEEKKAVKLIRTPAGEDVLDFGEMITGWVKIRNKEKSGKKILLQYGELLQEGNFYRENLRTAKAEFSYISNGKEQWVRPHFTFYGFRYVKISGMENININDLIACRIMSDCKLNGQLVTSNNKINQLIFNALSSQECNFIDIPTDCPQRDERMGWTGDIGVFADTACLNMECAGFLRHYLISLREEQKRLGGSIPFFSPYPKVKPQEGLNPFLVSDGACTWGDAATILPWTLFEHYQDINLLNEFYPMMWEWTMYEKERSLKNEIPYLWQNDRQLGDWLALDNGDINNPIGATDPSFISSAYFYYSVCLTLEAAKLLERDEDVCTLRQDKDNIYQAIQKEYFNIDGTLKIKETQTGYALALAMNLLRPEQKKGAVDRLKKLVVENGTHLNTGFVGTTFLMQALSENGENDLSYELLFQESYPSWLHEINLGATSIWERWNSVMPDGKVSGTEMNSMNHYAYGSVVSWIYRYACGFQPCLQERQTLRIKPMPNPKLQYLTGKYGTPWGIYEVKWEYVKQNQIAFYITVPYDGVAFLSLPGQFEQHLTAGEYRFMLHM